MRGQTVKKTVAKMLDVSRGRARYATIRDRVTDGVRIDGIHLCQLIAAMIIASIGLNTNSTEAVIGAMLICPLMGSVLALALAFATMDMRLFRRAGLALAIECGICLVTSTIYFILSPLHVMTSELITNTSATLWDVVIALVGGFAGALGLSRRQEPSTLVSGVAVATALMPPLCAVGYGLAEGNVALALSAAYEFLVNVVFIASGSTMVFLWLRMPLVGDLDGDGKEDAAERAEAERESHILRHRLVAAVLLFALPCLYFSSQTVQRFMADNGLVLEVLDTYDTEETTRELEVICPGFVSYSVGAEDSYESGEDAIAQQVVATVETEEELSTSLKRQIEAIIRIHVSDLHKVSFEVDDD